jgi:hypothetical protein
MTFATYIGPRISSLQLKITEGNRSPVVQKITHSVARPARLPSAAHAVAPAPLATRNHRAKKSPWNRPPALARPSARPHTRSSFPSLPLASAAPCRLGRLSQIIALIPMGCPRPQPRSRLPLPRSYPPRAYTHDHAHDRDHLRGSVITSCGSILPAPQRSGSPIRGGA